MSDLSARLRARSTALPTNGPTIAAQLAAKGFHVVPVAAPIRGDKDSGKQSGVDGKKWWERAQTGANIDLSVFEGRNVGVCGGYELPGGGWLTILDPDGPEGLSELAALEDKHGILPRTFTVRSGSGTGRHYYFRTKRQCGGSDLAGCSYTNTRGKGGQVVAPGCYHYSGGQYTIEVNAEIAWAPDWLEQVLVEPKVVVSTYDASEHPPVEVTREMCLQHANKIGSSHGQHDFFHLLGNGLPVAPPKTRHKVADINGTLWLVGAFTPGITDESVMKLLAPTYPLWEKDPIGPGADYKNWNDVVKALDGARRQYVPPMDLSSFNARFAGDAPFDLTVEHCRTQADSIGRATTDNAQQRKKWWKQLCYDVYVPITKQELPAVVDMVLATYPTATEESIARLLHSSNLTPADLHEDYGKLKKKATVVAEKSKNRLALYQEAKVMINEEGKPLPSAANIFKLIRAELGTELRANVRSLSIECRNLPWNKSSVWREFEESPDLMGLTAWLQDKHFILSTPALFDALTAVAEASPVDPFLEYLDNLPEWDGVERLERWLIEAAGVEDSLYTRAVSKKFVLSIVARAKLPGCKVDTKLVLVGGQGKQKSSLLESLVPKKCFDSTAKDPRESNKDYLARLHKFVIHEDAEMDTYSQSDIKADKAMITNRVDSFRKPYAKMTGTFRRRFVLCGSTNEVHGFLRDATGSRRYWPVRVGDLSLAWLRENREQLWAEAIEAFKKLEHKIFDDNLLPTDCYAWWLTPEEEELAKEVQKDHEEKDPWEDDIQAFLEREWTAEKVQNMHVGELNWIGHQQMEDSKKLKFVQAGQLLQLLGAPQHDRRLRLSVGRTLRKLGWELQVFSVQGDQVKAFGRT